MQHQFLLILHYVAGSELSEEVVPSRLPRSRVLFLIDQQ